jgi:hypothetical protein
MTKNLIVKAGKDAFKAIKEQGLKKQMIRIIPGAAGGPKWLVLNRFDRMLFSSFLKGQSQPVHLIGSSIGAWRFATMCQSNPVDAQAKFEHAYIHQTYASKPSPLEITSESHKIMDTFLDGTALQDILNHPWLRLNFISVRSRGPLSSESKAVLGSGLLGAYFLNLFHPKLLELLFERTLFTSPQTDDSFLSSKTLSAKRIQLTRENFMKALLSSGSIPLVMEGIRDIPGAPAGTYRDGGVLDYHLDLPYNVKDDEIVLYPHFTDRIIPGWLDKALKWRKPHAHNMKNVLMIAPSHEYISKLPNGKIPDRNDFRLYLGRDQDRFRDWKTVVERGQVLADEFEELVLSEKIRGVVAPL